MRATARLTHGQVMGPVATRGQVMVPLLPTSPLSDGPEHAERREDAARLWFQPRPSYGSSHSAHRAFRARGGNGARGRVRSRQRSQPGHRLSRLPAEGTSTGQPPLPPCRQRTSRQHAPPCGRMRRRACGDTQAATRLSCTVAAHCPWTRRRQRFRFRPPAGIPLGGRLPGYRAGTCF